MSVKKEIRKDVKHKTQYNNDIPETSAKQLGRNEFNCCTDDVVDCFTKKYPKYTLAITSLNDWRIKVERVYDQTQF